MLQEINVLPQDGDSDNFMDNNVNIHTTMNNVFEPAEWETSNELPSSKSPVVNTMSPYRSDITQLSESTEKPPPDPD